MAIQRGIAALLTTDGPEKNTIQYAPDGFNFEIVAVLKGAPEALGVYRSEDPDKSPLEGIRWGLCHVYLGLYGGHTTQKENFEPESTSVFISEFYKSFQHPASASMASRVIESRLSPRIAATRAVIFGASC